MIDFQNPYGLILLFFIPLFFLLRKIGILKKITFTAVLSDWNGKTYEWKGKIYQILSIFSRILTVLGFILCVFAFADPVISEQEKIYTSLGTDIVFVVDCSPSMAAKDLNNESRLEASKDSIFFLLQQSEGCRFGLVALGSNASVEVPVTSDLDFFVQQVENISVGQLGDGSAIGDGVSTAVCHLASSKAPRKCIVLLTDGENNAGEIHPETAAKLAVDNDISIYVVGIGSKGTVPIDYVDPITGKQYAGYLDSNFNASSLKKIAEIGGGHYYETKTINELNDVLSSVISIESTVQSYVYEIKTVKLYKKVLFLSILFFLIVFFIRYFILKETKLLKYKKKLLFREILSFFSFLFIVLAHLGISWGTYVTPVLKSGNSVAMVFDISYSMLANDGPENVSRLEAASVYAKKMLTRMNDVNISVVAAKGEGIIAIPLTQDYSLIESLLDVISPELMTMPGTSLGKGILKAKESLQKANNTAGQIWVFTDGEETDGELQTSLELCAKDGIPVVLIGFGNEKPSKTLAGDGKTMIETSLRQKELELVIAKTVEKQKIYRRNAEIFYINSQERASASKVLANLKNEDKDNVFTMYESKPVERFKFFLLIALCLFSLGFIITEGNLKKERKDKDKKNTNKNTFSSIMINFFVYSTFILQLFTGCSSETYNILQGTQYFKQKKYHNSSICFLEAVENSARKQNQEVLPYALYNLGTSYTMLAEEDAALEKYNQVLLMQGISQELQYSVYYNLGVMCFKNGDFQGASENFKQAIKIDNTKTDAKINMEMSMQMIQTKTRQNESKINPAGHNPNAQNDTEEKIFKHIKENDKKQWKNAEMSQKQNHANDY